MTFDSGSFRDPSSRVFHANGQVYRALSPQAMASWEKLQKTRFFQRFQEQDAIVGTAPGTLDLLPPSERGRWAGVIQHDRIPFISYPYEWSFGMLQDAALLHLELLSAALAEGFIVKDASPYNIQWKGTRPLFIDIPSFEPWTPGEPWIGYRQFCELFLFPLFLQAYRGIPFQPWLRGSLEGISTSVAYRLFRRYFYKPGVLTDVILHDHFQRRYADSVKPVRQELQKAGFRKELILANVRRLQKIVSALRSATAESHWNRYQDLKNYSTPDESLKHDFVLQVLQERHRRQVWDMGCNQGAFSRLAAEHADGVLAMDSDPEVIDWLFRSLQREGPTVILPLTVDFADLSPSRGWRGLERRAFTERGKPDLILCLALVHHMTITHHIPLTEWVAWLGDFKAEVVMEFPARGDSMVERLLANKAGDHDDYTVENFERILGAHFAIARREVLSSGTRILYACRPL